APAAMHGDEIEVPVVFSDRSADQVVDPERLNNAACTSVARRSSNGTIRAPWATLPVGSFPARSYHGSDPRNSPCHWFRNSGSNSWNIDELVRPRTVDVNPRKPRSALRARTSRGKATLQRLGSNAAS